MISGQEAQLYRSIPNRLAKKYKKLGKLILRKIIKIVATPPDVIF